jgi:hypothetical protein
MARTSKLVVDLKGTSASEAISFEWWNWWIINQKYFEGRVADLIKDRNLPEGTKEDLDKSVRKAGVQIQTKHLPNVSLECYR